MYVWMNLILKESDTLFYSIACGLRGTWTVYSVQGWCGEIFYLITRTVELGDCRLKKTIHFRSNEMGFRKCERMERCWGEW